MIGRDKRPQGGGGIAVHIPTVAVPYEACRIGGSLRPRPPVPVRHSRPGGRGATIIRTTTYAVADMRVRSGVSRTSGSVSHVRRSHGTGRASRFRTTVSQIASCAPRRSLRDEPDLDDRPLVEQPFAGELSFAQIVQSINQKSNDGAYRENVGASYGASQWGAGTE